MRRTALALFSSGCLLWQCGVAAAQVPELQIVAPSPPGSSWDQVAQALRSALEESGATDGVAVANVPGGAGLVGLHQFLSESSRGDLLVIGLTMLNAGVATRSYPKLQQLTPIARLSEEYYGIVVPGPSPIRSIGELRSVFLADPGRVVWAGGPLGSVDHVATVMFAEATGLAARSVNYVPFLASPDALTAAAENRVGAALIPLGDLSPDGPARHVRILAVTSPERLSIYDGPTLRESGIPLDVANWRGLAGRPGISPDQQARLSARLERAAATKPWRDLLARKNWREAFLPGDEFGRFLHAEQARVKRVLVSAGILKGQND